MKKVTQKALSLLLSLVMLFGMVQGAAVPAFAAGSEGVTAYYCDSGLFKDSNYTDGPVGEYNWDFRKTITNVEIKDSASAIGNNAFVNCVGLQSVSIPEGVTTIGEGAFYNCTNLQSVTFAEGIKLKTIGVNSFVNCAGLQNVSIPEGVTSIGEGAFSYCAGLQSVSIPASVTSIGIGAFKSCEKLAAIAVDTGNPGYRSNAGVLFTKDGTTLVAYPGGKAGTGYMIPDEVTAIGANAFSDCKLTSVTFTKGSKLVAIGDNGFSSCAGLQSMSIPAGVTAIGKMAFDSCANLQSVTFAEGSKLTAIGDNAFTKCTGLKGITVPAGVTSIGQFAFDSCTGLTSVIIAASVTTIGDQAFTYCSKLTEAIFESTTPPETVGYSVFDFCDSLTAIYVPSTALDGYKNKFSVYASKIQAPEAVPANTQFTAGGLKYEVTDAEKKTVKVISQTEKYAGNITIPEKIAYKGNSFSVTGIGEMAFFNCTGLQSVSIPAGVTTIGQNAFDRCTGLTSVTIPASVTSIGGGAFSYCTGLTGVTIPAGVTSIGDGAFANNSKLTEIAVNENNKNYCSVDDILFNKDKTKLIAYPAGKAGTNYTIPASVTAIVMGAFYGCAGLKSVIIPVGVTSIGDRTFFSCTGLTGVIIPSSVTSIGQLAFCSCKALTNVTIPSGVTSIGDSAFQYCTGLKSVIIPAGVTSIGQFAFSDCTGLTDMMFESAEPSKITTVGDYVFNGCGSLTVWVPGIALDGYKSTFDQYQDKIKAAEAVAKDTEFTGGSLEYKVTDAEKKTVEVIDLNKTYSGNLAIPEKIAYKGNVFSVTSIDGSATADCNGLTGVSIPSGVTAIGKGAFANNSELAEIAVDANNQAYSSVDGILLNKDKTTLVAYPASKAGTSYTIPAGVTSIGDGAFCGCTALTGVTIPASVTAIGKAAFARNSKLTEIAVNANNKNYCSMNGILFDKSKTTLISYPAGKAGTSYTIPAGVTSIGMGAFGSCAGLQSVSIPAGVTSIGYGVFMNCIGLQSVSIPAGVTSIGEGAFYGCANLTGVTIPASVTTIGEGAFYKCTALTGVTIPSGVTTIGEAAFYKCSKLTDVTLKGKVTTVEKGAFIEGANTSITFAVPGKYTDYYKTLLNSDVMGSTTANFAVIRLVTAIANLPAATSVAAGTALGALNLPGSLTVTVDGEKGTVNVTWSSSPKYDPTAAGTYTFTPSLPNGYVPDDGVNATYKVTVKPAVVVSGVMVSPSAVSVQKGNSYPFSAKVEGSNSSQTVTWSVSGNQSQSTAIDQSGKLTVAADETASTVSVKAASTDDTAKYGTAVVTVTSSDSSGDSGNSGDSGKNHSSSTASASSLPAAVTDSLSNATADLSGASFPAGVTGVAFSAAPAAQNNTADPQGAAAYRIAMSNASLNLIGFPFVYNLKLLDQNGNPITGFTGTVKVRIPLPAGLRGVPRVFRYEADGTLTDMKAAVENGFLVFSTDHFSYYVIAGSGDSITLDTRNYLMPVNGSYQVGVKLTGGKAASVKFRSTNGKTATVTKLKNGNYQVTGKNPGTAYIMFDVYDNKNKLLTHASVRVDVKTGTRPRGDSARQIAVF